MSLARLVVAAVRFEGRSKAEVAREYRVSRQWVHELIKRFDAEGEAGLEPRSRRPWGTETHAASSYSWMSPPSRSRLRTPAPWGAPFGEIEDRAGVRSPRPRCGLPF